MISVERVPTIDDALMPTFKVTAVEASSGFVSGMFFLRMEKYLIIKLSVLRNRLPIMALILRPILLIHLK